MTDTPAKKTPAKRAPRGVSSAARQAREKVKADTAEAIDTAEEQWADAMAKSSGVQVMPEPQVTGDVFVSPAVMSRPYPNVHELWARVMDSVKSVEKGDWNAQQKFRFRGIDATIDAVGPALRRHKVHVRPRRIVEHSATEYTTSGGTRMLNRIVRVEWEVTGPQGDSFVGESMGEAADAGDKSMSKAQSVAYRVFLLNALSIPTGDPDPDAESHERATPSEREQAVAQASARSYASREEFERERAAQPQQSPSQDERRQAQAGEEDQTAQPDNAEARKEMWRIAKGLGWQWAALAARFKADHGVESNQADAQTIESFTMTIVKEAEAEEDRAKAAAGEVLGAKEVAPDEAQSGGIL